MANKESTASAVNAASRQSYDAIIIGAGFSGLYQLHKLRDELGLNVVVLEKGDGIGGTWFSTKSAIAGRCRRGMARLSKRRS